MKHPIGTKYAICEDCMDTGIIMFSFSTIHNCTAFCYCESGDVNFKRLNQIFPNIPKWKIGVFDKFAEKDKFPVGSFLPQIRENEFRLNSLEKWRSFLVSEDLRWKHNNKELSLAMDT